MHILDNVFTTEHGEAITVLQLLTKIKTSISQIDEVLNTYLMRLDAIDTVNNTQNTDILVLKGNVDLLKSQVANIFTSLGDYLLQLQQLDILTQTHSSQITDIQNVNQNQGLQLINLNSKSIEHELKILGLETNVTNINNSLNNINNSIGDILLQLLQLDMLTQTHTSQISDLQNVNTTQTSQITNLSQMITDIEQRLSDLEPIVSTLTTNVQTLTTNMQNINTSINSLDARVTILENTNPGNGGSLTKLFSTSKQYAIGSGQGTTLELGTYIFAKLPPNTDFSKIILIAVPYGDSAGDCQEICRCGFQTSFYVQSGVDMFLYARFLIPANQNVSLRVNYTVYLRD